jgi:hypothetical protein
MRVPGAKELKVVFESCLIQHFIGIATNGDHFIFRKMMMVIQIKARWLAFYRAFISG